MSRRTSSAHLKQQAYRFARLFIVAYVPMALALKEWDGKALLALLVPALEVVWRQAFPTTPPSPVDPPLGQDTPAPVAYTAPRPVIEAKPAHGGTVIRLPETITPDGGRLGRHINHDPRSRSFAVTAAPIRSVAWKRHVKPFDQGQIGSCTGNALAGVLSTAPFRHRYTEHRALALYEAATRLDNYPGAYPPDDTGSDGNSVCKAARNLGIISGWRHAFGITQALQALQSGAWLAGISWYDSFDAPDSNGIVTITPGASVRGGHEIEGAELHMAGDTISGDDLIGFWQSWGLDWALHGRFFMRVRDFDRLLHERGDVTQPIA